MSRRFDQYRSVNHSNLLDAARTMADQPSAREACLSFDEAYTAIATFNFAYGNNTLIGDLMPLFDESAVSLSPASLFGVASSIDTLLSHGDPAQAQKAATFTIELVNTLSAATESETKQGILASVLGIELPSEIPVAQQLVERRLLPEGNVETQMALSARITLDARSM